MLDNMKIHDSAITQSRVDVECSLDETASLIRHLLLLLFWWFHSPVSPESDPGDRGLNAPQLGSRRSRAGQQILTTHCRYFPLHCAETSISDASLDIIHFDVSINSLLCPGELWRCRYCRYLSDSHSRRYWAWSREGLSMKLIKNENTSAQQGWGLVFGLETYFKYHLP